MGEALYQKWGKLDRPTFRKMGDRPSSVPILHWVPEHWDQEDTPAGDWRLLWRDRIALEKTLRC